MVWVGEACRIDVDASTQAIIDPRIIETGDPAEIAAACLSGVDPRIADRVRPGAILLADGAFGDGPDPQNAALALLAVGIVIVIARQPAPTFVDAAHHLGLPVLTIAPLPPWHDGDHVRVDLLQGQIRRRGDAAVPVVPPPGQVLAMMRHAMMWRQTRQMIEEEGDDG
jgi:3-isopropylmalate dehydratase small subunit